MRNKIIPIKLLKLQNTVFDIPQNILDLLWVSNENPSQHAIGMDLKISLDLESNNFVKILFNTCDPSTIFTRLPIKKIKNVKNVKKLDYFPSYLKISPEQRWIYLNWLKDTTTEIEIGYVFLFFYGLERHLLIGRFNESVNEIIKLRKFHKNKSFLCYSKSAITYSLIYRKNLSLLKKIIKELDLNVSDNVYLHIKNSLEEDLTPEELIKMVKEVGFNKRVYIQRKPDNFLNNVKNILIKKYSRPKFRFANRYDFNSLPKKQVITFANISFPDNLRSPELPNYFLHKPFVDEVYSIISEAYKRTKKTARN